MVGWIKRWSRKKTQKKIQKRGSFKIQQLTFAIHLTGGQKSSYSNHWLKTKNRIIIFLFKNLTQANIFTISKMSFDDVNPSFAEAFILVCSTVVTLCTKYFYLISWTILISLQMVKFLYLQISVTYPRTRKKFEWLLLTPFNALVYTWWTFAF